MTADEFWNSLPRLVWHLEEPVCEAPAVALDHITREARRHVKVLLSGEGGDEAFAGYSNYPNMIAFERLRAASGPFKGLVGGALRALGAHFRDERLARYGALMPHALEQHYWSRVGTPNARHGMNGAPMYLPAYAKSVRDDRASHIARRIYGDATAADVLSRMLYFDFKTWLPDDLLLKADKVTMANSLELRVPLLDHKVLEFAASLPNVCKVRGRQTKRVLKRAFASVLPPEVLKRKKAGFPVPYAGWLAGALRPRVEALLLDRNAFVARYFERAQIELLLAAHVRNPSHQRSIFSLVVLELWNQTFVGPTRCERPELAVL